MTRDWPPLPGWAVEKALPVSVRNLERIRTVAGLRTLMALHVMAAFDGRPWVQGTTSVTCSHRDIRSWSGLSNSAVQKGVAELVGSGCVLATDSVGTVPKTYTLLP